MSEFISVYDVVFGVRKLREDGAPRKPLPGWQIEPTGINLVASAIEVAGIHCFDDYSRFRKANDDQAKIILDALAVYGEICDFKHPSEVQEYEAGISEPENVPEWHSFGWEREELPDFSECHDIWLKGHNSSGPDPVFATRGNDKKWDVIIACLRASLFERPEIAKLKGDEKFEKFDEILDEITNPALRSSYTSIIKNHLEGLGVSVDDKTLKSIISQLPDRVRTSR